MRNPELDAFYANEATDEWWTNLRDRGATSKRPPGFRNEVRWGDAVNFDVLIPALSTADETTGLKHIVEVREKPRTWSLSFSLQWLNAAQANALESLSTTILLEYGVGSAKVVRFINLTVTTTLPLQDVILPVLPAEAIRVAAAVGVTGVQSGAARTYLGRVAVFVAPYTRE